MEFKWCRCGEYHLVQEPGSGEDSLWLALAESSSIQGSGDFATVAELKDYLASRGAIVDKPAEDS